MSSTRRWLPVQMAGAAQRGGMLVETAVAILVFSIVGVVVLSGVSTGAKSSRAIAVQSTLENLARNQIEYVLGQTFQDPEDPPAACAIDPGLAIPSGYSLDCEVGEYVPGDINVASVVVTASNDDGKSLALETVRAR